MKIRVLLVFLAIFIYGSLVFAQSFGVKQRTLRPHEYGNVVMNNVSEKNEVAPVVFNHWLHRALYTCRVCHVDLGFAMKAGATGVTEDDNKRGIYCGACHNGKEAFGPEGKDVIGKVTKNCYRCHSYNKKVKLEKDFYEYTKNYPKSRFGNKVDWIAAEEAGIVKLKDYLEGITIKRKPLTMTKNIDMKSKEIGMPDIIYSHTKHTIWNGCELCHPEIFGARKGSTKFNMQDVFEGKYCGSCHGKVAFPNNDCQLCHTKEV